MPRSSWLDDHKTVRRYVFADGSEWVVQNEYQPVACPHCDGIQYQRLTHIWRLDPGGVCQPEYHINRDTELSELQKLLVSYAGPDLEPVYEEHCDGAWFLVMGDTRIPETAE